MKLSPLDPWICRKVGSNHPVVQRRELEAWQLSRLNETMELVRAKSRHYRELFRKMPEKLESLDDLCQFSFTSAEDIRCNPLRFVCVSQDEIQRVVSLQSSGTTGEPKRLFFTQDDQKLTIDFFGVGMSTLTEPGERVLILLPGEKAGSVGDLLKLGLEQTGRQPIPHGVVRDPHHTLEVMQTHQVDCLVGAPVQVLGLARRWNPTLKAPRTILLSTDTVPDAIVRELENIWGCRVFNHYGMTEMGLGGGVDCEAHCGYHLREADLLFEVVHPETGQVMPDGEYGEVVFSTLTRRGMPLIRYRTGDRSRFIPSVCPCGTNLRRLEKVCGRLDGTIQVGDQTLSMFELDEVLFPISGLLNFSVAVVGDYQKPSLVIELQMLSDNDAVSSVRKALKSVRSISNVEMIIRCRKNPDESGSLAKRIIQDERGEYA
jgi:phenylacetate-coenzyme A ligase PaaK-like adenylate-forming protein